MRRPISNKNMFPSEVMELLRSLHKVGFFEDSALIGSWVMPLYQDVFGIPYALRTLDIDFAVKFATSERGDKIDLENVITTLGYVPVVMLSGIRKFTQENFTVEFVVQRKGGRDDEAIGIRKWNIIAVPLPFVNILLDFTFIADFGDFQVKAPIPEAYFIQKMLIAHRRPGESKRHKDFEQCSVIAGNVDHVRLEKVLRSLKLSAKNKKAMRDSCKTIDFPPQLLGLL